MALTGTKALIVWCQQVTHGYKDVEIRNMTSSWRDGLAFCAILHHYRPDLINFDNLSKENIAENNDLAFTVAEHELGIPALLDVEDMVELTVPDKLSIMTYVSQYYQYFRDKVPGEIPKKHASKRQSPYNMDDLPKKKPAPGITAAKEAIGSTPNPSIGKGTIDRFCANCGKTVYLMERLQVEGKLFHRVCFTCTACELQLRMGTYRYIPTEDKFYCDKHYRQRTTSISSGDSRKSRSDSHKNEQDALKNLLESLENKRKTVKEKEDDKSLMKHNSVHQRIANARKMFTETSGDKMDVDHHPIGHGPDGSPQGSPRQPPPRPMQPPSRIVDSSEEGTKKPESVDVLSTTEGLEGAQHKGPPSRPANPPGQISKDNLHQHDHHIKDRDQARGFLTGLIPKMEMEDGKEVNKMKDEKNVPIYETPFACNSVRAESTTNEGKKEDVFENPRYRESLKMDAKPIYENQGPCLLSLDNRKSVENLNEKDEENLSNEERHESEGEHVIDDKPIKKKKLILKVKKKHKKGDTQSRISMNLEGSGSENGDDKKGEKIAISSDGDDLQVEEVDKEEEKGNSKEVGEVDDDSEHVNDTEKVSDADSMKGQEEKELKGFDEEKEDKDENGGKEDVLFNEMEGDEFNNQEATGHKEDDEVDNEKEEENEETAMNEAIDTDNDKEQVSETKDEEMKEDEKTTEMMPEIERSEEDDIISENNENRDENVTNESNDKEMEGTPYETHKKEQETKGKKVLKYVNPFDSSDEEMTKSEDKPKMRVVLNPFEVDSESELLEDTKEVDDFSSDDGIGRAVSRKTKLIPGEGPKTPLTAEELAEHQKKIEDIKKGLIRNEKEKYINPFEESDDDLLEKDESRNEESNEVRKQELHEKRLVLKVKKKKRAPQPPVEMKKPAPKPPVDTVATEGKVGDGGEVEKTGKEGVAAKANLAPVDPLETFKTYIGNSEVEMRKRLDSKTSRISYNEQLKHEQAISPTSASCPALNITGFHDKIRADDASIEPDEETRHDKEQDAPDADNEAAKKKEKPPKRPAPPVPKGIMPYKDIIGASPIMVRAKESPNMEAEHDKDVKMQRGEVKEKVDKKKDVKKKTKEKTEEIEKKKEKNKRDEKENEKENKKKKDKEKRIEKEKQKGAEMDNENEKEKKKAKNKEKKNQKELEVKEDKKGKMKVKGGKDIENKNENSKEPDVIEDHVGLVRTYSIIEEKEMSLDDIGIELKEIEEKQRVLEQKGVKMEKRLREQLHGEPEEDYMITWFDLVTEKNKLLRRENELIYMSQEIEYHGYQKKIEFELRLLMEKDESLKTQEDRDAEEQLLQQLVNYVSRRNKIVEKIEQDRLREKDEDEQIQMIMQAQGLRKQKKKKAGKKNSTGSTFYT